MNRRDFDVLHLGCGEDYHEDAWNVDAVGEVDPDEQYNLEELPWPWESETFDAIRAFHLFEHLDDMEAALRESERILRPGGTLALKLPMGNDAIADPDHDWGGGNPWTWRTPEFYTGKRHWDIDVGLEVEYRDCELWSLGPTWIQQGFMQSVWEWRIARNGCGEWCFSLPRMSGEFTVVFRKPDHE